MGIEVDLINVVWNFSKKFRVGEMTEDKSESSEHSKHINEDDDERLIG